MLKAETRFMIKDLHRKDVTISDIARIAGHDRKTIRATLKSPISPSPRKRKARARKLDPFIPYLEKRMAEGVFNSKKLLDEIRRQGCQGGWSQLRAFVHPCRKLGARKPRCALRPSRASKRGWIGPTLGSSSTVGADAGCMPS